VKRGFGKNAGENPPRSSDGGSHSTDQELSRTPSKVVRTLPLRADVALKTGREPEERGRVVLCGSDQTWNDAPWSGRGYRPAGSKGGETVPRQTGSQLSKKGSAGNEGCCQLSLLLGGMSQAERRLIPKGECLREYSKGHTTCFK